MQILKLSLIRILSVLSLVNQEDDFCALLSPLQSITLQYECKWVVYLQNSVEFNSVMLKPKANLL